MLRSFALGVLAAALLAGCGDGDGPIDNSEALAYSGLDLGKIWSYDVEVDTFVLAGLVDVVQIDPEFVDGVDAYKVDVRQNQNLVATRWYQITPAGLFLLGEDVKEGSTTVQRTFETPIEVIRYPLENEAGVQVQGWTTESALEEGGSETHRFDNAGKVSLDLPAGTFEAFHLVHTRTDKDGGTHQYDEYFVPREGYVEFEYPEDNVWKLKPEG